MMLGCVSKFNRIQNVGMIGLNSNFKLPLKTWQLLQGLRSRVRREPTPGPVASLSTRGHWARKPGLGESVTPTETRRPGGFRLTVSVARGGCESLFAYGCSYDPLARG
jgi:hypothetical protein